MKKAFLFLSVATVAVVSFTSCEKIKEKLFQAFVTGTTSANVTLNTLNNTSATADWGSVSIPFDIEQEIEDNTGGAFSLNNVPKVTMNEIVVTILNPDQNNNWANFENGTLRFNTNSNNTPVLVGKYENNPDVYAATKTFVVENTADLKSYLKDANTVNFLYAGKLRRPTTKALNLRLDFKLNVGN